MADISALVASIDTRLDQLAAQISTLEHARTALQARTLMAASAAPRVAGAAAKRARRPASPTTKPTTAPARPARPAAAPKLSVPPATGEKTRTTPPAPRRRAAGAGTRGKRSGSSLSADQLQRVLADARSGLSAGAIAEQAGASYNRVLALLRELESSGTIRRTGSRRSTLWLLITDEDRIAQRAAELERLMGARRDDRTQRRGRAPAS
ncbi:MAG: hypothetical protein ABSH51_27945 [Solirubrobacteraceae bacterium]|jgi:hypothetical protein